MSIPIRLYTKSTLVSFKSKVIIMKKQKKSAVSRAPKNKEKVEKAPKAIRAEKVEKTEKIEKKEAGIKIAPLGDRVLVKPSLVSETEKKSDFGIIIPETVSKERPEQGEIIAVGEGKRENGKLIPIKVKVGDKVIFSRYGFDEVKNGEDELYILKEENILAIIKK